MLASRAAERLIGLRTLTKPLNRQWVRVFHGRTVPANMSVACSSSQKTLESPFSHRELFGREHPLQKKKARHKKKGKSSSSPPVSRKQRHQANMTSLSTASVTSAHNSSSSSCREGKSKNKRKTGKRSKTEQGGARRSSPTGATVTRMLSPPLDLAKVDAADSPKVQKKNTAAGAAVGGASGRKARVNGTSWYNRTESCSTMTESHSNSHDIETPISHSRSSSTVSSVSTISLKSHTTNSATVNIHFTRAPHKIPPVRRAFDPSSSSSFSRFSQYLPARSFSGDRRRGWREGGCKGGGLTVADIASGLARRQFRNVVVMSGAGISTPSGIPDFRTPGSGLYDNLQQYKIPEPAAIFDISYFSLHPRPFLELARELYPGKYRPNVVHWFVRLLQEQGALLRNYTQNIDGLERLAGVKPGKLVEAHGSFSTASCIRCESKQDPEAVKKTIFEGKIPRCKHKNCLGLVKPDVVFFGEDLPQRFHSLQLADFTRCDLLVVMGTSLEVEPFASLASLPRYDVPRLLLNREPVGPFKSQRQRRTDVAMIGDLVSSVWKLAASVGWTSELQELVASCGSDGDGRGGGGEGGEGGGGGTARDGDIIKRSDPKVTSPDTATITTTIQDETLKRENHTPAPPAPAAHSTASHNGGWFEVEEEEEEKGEIEVLQQQQQQQQQQRQQQQRQQRGDALPLHSAMLGLSLSDKREPDSTLQEDGARVMIPKRTPSPPPVLLSKDQHITEHTQSLPQPANSKLEREKPVYPDMVTRHSGLRGGGVKGLKTAGAIARSKSTAASWTFAASAARRECGMSGKDEVGGAVNRLQWRINYFYSGLHKS